MERKIIYIINPISGTGDKNSIREIIEKQTKKAGISYSVYPSVADGDYTFLHHTIEEESITDVVIAGGDGTINQVINNLKKFNVAFGIIPSGSGNGLAFSAGIPKNISAALKIIFKRKEAWTDAFLINDTFACMLCGLGFDAQVAHDFANAPKRGLGTYLQKTISNFISAPTYNFVLQIGKREVKKKAYFISIANSNQFGNHFTIAPKASLTDGMLDVVIMVKQNKMSVLFQTIKQISGFNEVKSVDVIDETSSVIYFQTTGLKIINTDDAPLHIDGDPVETLKELDIKILKNSFQLIFP